MVVWRRSRRRRKKNAKSQSRSGANRVSGTLGAFGTRFCCPKRASGKIPSTTHLEDLPLARVFYSGIGMLPLLYCD
jgi:hypothetical protein